MNNYQSVINAVDLPDSEVKRVLALLLESLSLQIVMEKTPDYVAFEIVSKGSEK